MQTTRVQDPLAFREKAEPYLRQDEARHNLMLGLLETLIERPDVYPDFGLWAVEDAGATVGAALITPPFNLVVAAPAKAGTIECLAAQLLDEGTAVPGVVAALPEADVFLEAYAPAAGVRVCRRQEQAIHLLGSVENVPKPPGAARPANESDLELVLAWTKAFHEEAGSATPWDEERTRRNLAHKIPDGGGGGMRIWENDLPVCLVGFVPATSDTARVGPVYTPPEQRRRGFGTALTAHVTRELLDRGMEHCMLYTDLANPTSNAIYHRIGYRVVCDAAMIAFEPMP